MRILLFWFLIGFTFVASAHPQRNANGIAAKTSKSNVVLKKDTAKVTQRKFDEKAIKKYRSQREFRYNDTAPESESLWGRLWKWFWKMFNDLFSGKVTGNLIKYLLTAIVILLIVFIAIKLTGLDYKFLIKRSKTVPIPFEENLENIHEIDFDEQIEKAIVSLNYRLAVRLMYLKTLKRLSDSGLINWQLEKTNQTYVTELSDENKRNDFAALTNQFEYIWYGDFFIDKTAFEEINESFNQFTIKLR